MKIEILGIDLAKSVFYVHGADKNGKKVLGKTMTRSALLRYVATCPVCIIAMESCGGAHYFARKFKEYGHQVRLISPQFVKPFVKSNKNDKNDAEAITEAASRPSMRFVPVNSIEQQDIQSLHRVRQRLVGQRTALINQIRGLLTEYGIVLPQLISTVKRKLPEILEDGENELSPPTRRLFAALYDEISMIQSRIDPIAEEINRVATSDERCKRLLQVEGIGPLTATAIVAAVGNGRAFKNGRQMSAWLGLTPSQFSSGGKERLGHITKRGDTYLRTLLIHGARSTIRWAKWRDNKKARWIKDLQSRRGNMITAVAIANKHARVIWALLAHDQEYQLAA